MRSKKSRALVFCVLSVFLLGASLLAASPVSAADSDDFVITVKTDNPGTSGSTQFTIPVHWGETYNYNVDCNNDGTDEITGAVDAYTCNYAAAGTYTIRIKDNNGDGTGFPRLYFTTSNDDRDKLLAVEQWGTGKWTTMQWAFSGCHNLSGQPSDTPNLTHVTNMGGMFSHTDVFNADLSDWDTSHVTNMAGMFASTGAFNQDLSGWDTSSVTNMSQMFDHAEAFNQDLSAWDTSAVTDMSGMFAYTDAFNGRVGGWDTSRVTDMA